MCLCPTRKENEDEDEAWKGRFEGRTAAMPLACSWLVLIVAIEKRERTQRKVGKVCGKHAKTFADETIEGRVRTLLER